MDTPAVATGSQSTRPQLQSSKLLRPAVAASSATREHDDFAPSVAQPKSGSAHIESLTVTLETLKRENMKMAALIQAHEKEISHLTANAEANERVLMAKDEKIAK